MALHHPFFSVFGIGSRSIKLTVFSFGRVPDISSQCFLVYAFSWYYFFSAYFSLFLHWIACPYIPTPLLNVCLHLIFWYHLNKLYFFSYCLKYCEPTNLSPFFTMPLCSASLFGTVMVTKDTSSWRKEGLTFTQLEEIKINSPLSHI